MKIVIACDSFKGSLTAPDACAVIAAEVRAAVPAGVITCVPLADGGEGTMDALLNARQGDRIACHGVCGPLPEMRRTAAFGWVPDSRLAIVESAAACGLPLLTPAQRNPLRTTTRGVGELLRAAMAQGARELLLTLGGSATVDAGTGAARVFGWRFLDAAGNEVSEGGGGLAQIRRIVPPPSADLPLVRALCDVRNPLCGPQGAAPVFGPQKGATPAMVEALDAGLRQLAAVLRDTTGTDILDLPGAGAAGGFGGGAVVFFGARLTPGFAAVAEACRFGEAVHGADWVITGEGCFDSQSLEGKVVSGVRDAACAAGARVAVLAGRIRLRPEVWRRAGFAAAMAAAPARLREAEALAQARELLAAATRRFLATPPFLTAGSRPNHAGTGPVPCG